MKKVVESSLTTKLRAGSNIAYYANSLEIADPASRIVARPKFGLAFSDIIQLTQARNADNITLSNYQDKYKIVPLASLYGFVSTNFNIPFTLTLSTAVTTTGVYTFITVPRGANNMRVAMWGAAGANDRGGNGAFVSGDLSLTSNASYRIVVGRGGKSDFKIDSSLDEWGGPGVGGRAFYGNYSCDGGGRSAIQQLIGGNWVDIASAGGGGGGSGRGNFGNRFSGGAATAGGTAFQGGQGTYGGTTPARLTSSNFLGGGGGGQSSGGQGSSGQGTGTLGFGGSVVNVWNAGGGGGGFYGGGAAYGWNIYQGIPGPDEGGGGGGGSSLIGNLGNFLGYDGNSPSISSSSLYVTGRGVTDPVAGNSLDGIVYYSFF